MKQGCFTLTMLGDVFIGANGELSTFVAIERVVFPEGIKVYNFTVDGNHSYFVLAEVGEYGQTSILVHNGMSCGNHANALKTSLKKYLGIDTKGSAPYCPEWTFTGCGRKGYFEKKRY